MNGQSGSYGWWRDAAWGLLEPLLPLMEDGAAELGLAGPASDHDGNADRLEAYARPCLLAAFWLQSERGGAGDEQRDFVAKWFRRALLLGTDPEHPSYWGPNASYHQNGVEMGLLVIALKAAKDWLWNPLADAERQQVARWMASNRGTGHHWNNHLFFGVMALEFLREEGLERASDAAACEVWFTEMERMYRGDGWFMDGMNQSYDHYNAYAFHFYGPVWARFYGDRQPERSARWLEWSRLFVRNYDHFFAASGEHPAFGRSISYRFNASAPFAAAALAGSLSIPFGRARRLMTRNLDFFLNKPIQQEQGALSLGWHDAFPELAEKYSCAGSPYWAAKSFICLLMPPEHEFWTAPEAPLPAEEGDYALPIAAAGLVVRATGGEVEILNAGSEITPVNKEKFGPWKWGKQAYRTGVGFAISHSNDEYSPDMGLTVSGGKLRRTYGRHFTTPTHLGPDYIGSVYSLGDKYEQINTVVESLVFWHGGWLLQFHRYDNYQSMRPILGGFALADRDAESLRFEESGGLLIATSGERATVLQPLCDASTGWDKRLDDESPRRHVEAPYHATPLIYRPEHKGEGWLAALCWTGKKSTASGAWKITGRAAGAWEFEHAALGKWQLSNPLLPQLTP